MYCNDINVVYIVTVHLGVSAFCPTGEDKNFKNVCINKQFWHYAGNLNFGVQSRCSNARTLVRLNKIAHYTICSMPANNDIIHYHFPPFSFLLGFFSSKSSPFLYSIFQCISCHAHCINNRTDTRFLNKPSCRFCVGSVKINVIVDIE